MAHTAVVVPAQIETFFATFFTNDAVWIGRALDHGGGVDGQLKQDSGDKDGSDWDGGDLDREDSVGTADYDQRGSNGGNGG